MVQKDGITIDGAGYTLRGQKAVGETERGIYLVGADLPRTSCRNVVVKNLRIIHFWTGIYVIGASSNTIIDNYFEDARIHVIGCAGSGGDRIEHNIFRDTGVFVDYNPCGLDVIIENNFFNGWIAAGLSDVPIVRKNYWSDYNGTDNDGDGIGDTPHTSQYVLDENVQDPFPLMAPLDLEVIPEFPSWILATLFLTATLSALIIKKKLF
jgi:nitrous oxidase accessory protein NosD